MLKISCQFVNSDLGDMIIFLGTTRHDDHKLYNRITTRIHDEQPNENQLRRREGNESNSSSNTI